MIVRTNSQMNSPHYKLKYIKHTIKIKVTDCIPFPTPKQEKS